MRVLSTAIALAAFVSVAFAPGLHAEESLSGVLVELHEAGRSYLLQRDALLADDSLRDEALALLMEHDDWRVRHTAELLRALRLRPDVHAIVSTVEPAYDRAGRPRFDLPVMRDPDARAVVVERLLHADEPAPVRAALALSLVGLRADWDRLQIDLLSQEHAREVRLILVSSMRRAGTPAALSGLALGLADEDAQVRAEACRSVGWRSDGELWSEQLVEALNDGDPEVRAMAARALGWRQIDSAFESILPGLRDDSADVRLHSLRALSRLDGGATRDLAAVVELQSDSDARVARLAARIIAPRSP